MVAAMATPDRKEAQADEDYRLFGSYPMASLVYFSKARFLKDVLPPSYHSINSPSENPLFSSGLNYTFFC